MLLSRIKRSHPALCFLSSPNFALITPCWAPSDSFNFI